MFTIISISGNKYKASSYLAQLELGYVFFLSCLLMTLSNTQGSSVPLVVKWADTEKERQARRAQKAQSQASSLAYGNSMHQPSIFGALPMGYIPPYNGYGYQVGYFYFFHA